MKFNTKYYKFIDILQLLSGVVSLVTGVIAIISLYQNEKSKFLFYTAGCALIFIIMLLLLVAKYWGMAISRYENYNDKLHGLNHKLRDEIYRLKKIYGEGQLTNEVLISNVTRTGEFVVNVLSDLLTEITGNKISVHIKTFPVTSSSLGAYRTLCICTKSDQSRLTINDHPIDKNTHMLRIVEGQEPYFFSTNFKKTIDDYEKATSQEFLITSKNWKNWFKSIIVVPIRIDSNLRNINDGSKFEYLGFICCDAKQENAFRHSEKEAHLHLLKAYADILYVYLDEIRNYSKLIQ